MTVTTISSTAMAAGAAVILLLGVAHLAATLQSKPAGGPMSPTDPVVQAAMVRPGGIGMAPDLDSSLWRAWIGFNLSHALGVVVIAAIVLVQVLTGVTDALDQAWFLALVFGVPLAYLALSVNYWFRAPTVGIALGTVFLWLGALVGMVA